MTGDALLFGGLRLRTRGCREHRRPCCSGDGVVDRNRPLIEPIAHHHARPGDGKLSATVDEDCVIHDSLDAWNCLRGNAQSGLLLSRANQAPKVHDPGCHHDIAL